MARSVSASLSYHKHKRLYYKKLGKVKSEGGKLTDKFFWLGSDEVAALRDLTYVLDRWNYWVSDQPAQCWTIHDYAEIERAKKGDEDLEEIERDEAILAAVKASKNPIAVGSASTSQEILTPTFRVTSIEQAAKDYLKDQEFRLTQNRNTQEHLKISTFVTLQQSLNIALTALDVKQPIHLFTADDLRTICRYWNSSDRKIAARTATNYVRNFKQFLLWVDGEERYGFKMPRKYKDLFRRYQALAEVGTPESYSEDQLKAIFKVASPRTQLFCLLGLNCGYLGVDISDMKQQEIIWDKQQPYIYRMRSKTEKKNRFRVLHVLWPETAALLKRFLAATDKQANPEGRALLTEDGQPLLRFSPPTNKRLDMVGKAFENVANRLKAQNVEGHFTFKQLRATGTQRIVDQTGLQDIARMYRGEAIPGSQKYYVADDYQRHLTPTLNRLHDELKSKDVFASIKTG